MLSSPLSSPSSNIKHHHQLCCCHRSCCETIFSWPVYHPSSLHRERLVSCWHNVPGGSSVYRLPKRQQVWSLLTPPPPSNLINSIWFVAFSVSFLTYLYTFSRCLVFPFVFCSHVLFFSIFSFFCKYERVWMATVFSRRRFCISE